MTDHSPFVGTPVERVEDQRHLCGHAQFVDDLPRRAGQEAAGLHRVLDPRQLGVRHQLGVAHRGDLLLGDGAHEPQLAEHLHVLLVVVRRRVHRRGAALGDEEVAQIESSISGQIQYMKNPTQIVLPNPWNSTVVE